MRLIANLLLTVSLAVGALAAATAYNVSLALPDDELNGLTLQDNPGHILGLKGKPLTLPAVGELREQSVSYVRVREFSFWRWPGKWFFFAALLGLLVAAGLIRMASRREIAAAGAAREEEGPEDALCSLRVMMQELRERLHELAPVPARLQLILSTLGEAQRTHLTAFVEARPVLIARLGLTGFAELMSSYAAAERQINRAWSAAADGAYEEALHCLELAGHLLEEALTNLSAGKAG